MRLQPSDKHLVKIAVLGADITDPMTWLSVVVRSGKKHEGGPWTHIERAQPLPAWNARADRPFDRVISMCRRKAERAPCVCRHTGCAASNGDPGHDPTLYSRARALFAGEQLLEVVGG